jgi:peptidoglycan/LPS O-acetylase OafA/YrhL
MPKERRYDIDWLRVIAIGLLLVYHTAIGFQPWGVLLGFITNASSWPALWPPMTMLNVWRIPLLFFIAGMGTYMAIGSRDWKQVIAERCKRIGLPLLFGAWCIVPLHILLIQLYYKRQTSYMPGLGHLWFLANLLLYVLLLLPLFYFLKKRENSRMAILIRHRAGAMSLLLLIVLIMAAESVLLKPAIFELYAFTAHGFVLGLLGFLFGYMMMYSGKNFKDILMRGRWFFILLAFLLFLLRLEQVLGQPPVYLLSIESTCWIFSLLGFAGKYLNRPGAMLSYLKDAAYPVYIIHMAVLYAASTLIFPLETEPWIKYFLLLVSTFAGSLLIYELVLRRIGIFRMLFGLKKPIKEKMFE